MSEGESQTIEFSQEERFAACGSNDVRDHLAYVQERAEKHGDKVFSYIFQGEDLTNG